MSSIKFLKDPLAVLDYTIDWSDFLTDGDTIIASEWINASMDITIDSNTFTSTTATAWVSGGITNNSYDLVNHITTVFGRENHRVISIFIIEEPNELSDLIPDLRAYLGDTNLSAFRYTDEWLYAALVMAVKSLQRWWRNRYLFDTSGKYIARNPNSTFTFASPPEIEDADQRALILMASVIIKSGQLENSSWSTSTWRDAEYYVSNVEGGRMKDISLKRDWDELLSILKPPQRRLNVGAREAFNFGSDETL